MKFITVILLLLTFTFVSFAQATSKILGVANGRDFTSADLDPNVRPVWENFPGQFIKFRKTLLEQQIVDTVLNLEASEQKISIEELVDKEVTKKVTNPSAAEIKAVYDANKSQIGNKTLEEIRPQIVSFLRREPEQKAYLSYISQLKNKHKVKYEKDVNSANLKSDDVLASIDETIITSSAFEKKNALNLYEYEANVAEQAIDSLQQAMDSALILAESQALGIPPSQYIARETTNKMKDFTPAEEEKLQTDLRNRLYQKYKANIFIKEPRPFLQSISADDDPFRGKQNAPVTVVMFTDFQCPACSATHPVLKQVIVEFGDKIKFVVRDFPLTQIHENAFNAALAANAANKQGKFFEYTELIYDNQTSLDLESLKKYAVEVGLDVKRFEKDFADKTLAEEIRKDMQDGSNYGVNSTPSIFVNGYKIRTLSAASFRKAIQRALK
ncbi:MAG: DsbA family protein [Aridibacter sp.]